MNIVEAANYQDAFDAIDLGTANSVQIDEAEAVIQMLTVYLQSAELKVKAFRSFEEAGKVFLEPPRYEAVRKALDGDAALPGPRVTLTPKVVEPTEPVI